MPQPHHSSISERERGKESLEAFCNVHSFSYSEGIGMMVNWVLERKKRCFQWGVRVGICFALLLLWFWPNGKIESWGYSEGEKRGERDGSLIVKPHFRSCVS
jgi:hypothetical protein